MLNPLYSNLKGLHIIEIPEHPDAMDSQAVNIVTHAVSNGLFLCQERNPELGISSPLSKSFSEHNLQEPYNAVEYQNTMCKNIKFVRIRAKFSYDSDRILLERLLGTRTRLGTRSVTGISGKRQSARHVIGHRYHAQFTIANELGWGDPDRTTSHRTMQKDVGQAPQ